MKSSTVKAMRDSMSERDYHAEAVEIVENDCDTSDLEEHVFVTLVREYESEALIRQMVEMSKEEGLVDFTGWIKAAEKYLKGK